MDLIFLSDNLVDTCNGSYTLPAGTEWVLQSPGFPESYEPDTHCEWRFLAPFGHSVVFLLLV